MKLRLLVCLLAGCVMVQAEEKLPSVEEAIPASVKALGVPQAAEFPKGLTLAISAATDEAQKHVLAGMNELNGGWEFQASRHFAAAMQEDPDCLLAHWGMVVSLLAPSPETGAARNAATDRLLMLINQGAGTVIERGYAYGLIKYIEGGPAAAGEAFRKVSDRYPNEMQAAIFYALFTRSGYDVMGSATPEQEKAERILLDLIQKFPESPVPLNAYLTIHAEAPDLTEALPLARQLTQIAPHYAPYHHLLGHYEWRCGNHAKAATAFGRASALYAKWMKENSATVADCPEWVRSESYRTVSLASKGDFETALASAKRLASTPIPEKRLSSPGGRMILWEAKTLPARILMRRGSEISPQEITATLPPTSETKGYRDHSLAFWWIDALRIALDAKRLLNTGEIEKARSTLDVLDQHNASMSQFDAAAQVQGEKSALIRAFNAVESISRELRGSLALAGSEAGKITAYNWFRSAADQQKPASLLMPPALLMPMAARVGDYYLVTQKPAEAADAYEEALIAFPNDIQVLRGLEKACNAANLKERAAAAADKIRALQVE